MAMKQGAYPANWNEISASIRARAGDKCEWCGIPNGEHIHRLKSDPAQWITHLDWKFLPSYKQALYTKVSKIVLTVSHFDHDTTNNDPGNLNALCNRCHLKHDGQYHAQNARKTRAAKKAAKIAESGQLELFK
jgi:hypothetical protein